MGKKTEQTSNEQTSAKKNGLTPVNKITVATVCGKIKVADLPPEGEEMVLCRIAGYATGTKTGTTQYGTWAAATGDFAATNMSTGEIFAAKTAIVPGAMGDMIIATLEEKLREDATQKLAFSCEIAVKRSPRNPDEKYEYIVRPIMETEFRSPAVALLGMSE